MPNWPLKGGAVRDRPTDQNFRGLAARGGEAELLLARGVNVQGFGASTSSADNTAAVMRAKESLGPTGGTLFFPGGIYKFNGQLNFDDTRSIRLVGLSGLTAGNTAATQLRFIQTGSESAISARSAVGFSVADLSIYYESGSYTGALLDLTHSTGLATDSAYTSVERCQFAGLGVRTAVGIKLDKAIVAAIRSCYFQNLDVAVIGQKEPGSYSNSIRFDACTFAFNKTAALKNAGEAWYVAGCTFEPLISGAASCHAHDAFVLSQDLTVAGCWMGDITGVATSYWIDFYGYGLTVSGNLLGGNVASKANVTAIYVIDALSEGIVVTGNYFNQPKQGVILGKGVTNYVIGANVFSSVTTKASLDGGATDAGEGFLANGIESPKESVAAEKAEREAADKAEKEARESAVSSEKSARETGDTERVVGPASATESDIAVYSGTTGKIVKDGGKTVAQVLARENHTGTQLTTTISNLEAAYGQERGLVGVLAPQLLNTGQAALLMTANNAYIMRFVPTHKMTAKFLSFLVTTAATKDDACDVGIYSANLKTRLVSSGAKTGFFNALGVRLVEFSPTTLEAGTTYYAAISCGTVGGTAASVAGASFVAGGYANLFGSGAGTAATGLQATAHPLPTEFTSAGGTNAPIVAVRES